MRTKLIRAYRLSKRWIPILAGATRIALNVMQLLALIAKLLS